MNRDLIDNEYFEWIYESVCRGRFPKQVSYRKLLMFLHNTEFTYSIPNDENRAADGVELRYRFGIFTNQEGIEDYIEGPCSVLEMMFALAIRCEEWMDDTNIGDRTNQWFWGMIVNLGLGPMADDNFDRRYVEDVIETFLRREYSPNGKGGLFSIRGCDRDLRTVEIWHQLCWYLDSIM